MPARSQKRAPDPWRQRLLDAISDTPGDTLESVSKMLDRNAAYLHQYIYRATPRVLGEKERLFLADRYDIPQKDLMPPGWISDSLIFRGRLRGVPGEGAQSRMGETPMNPTRKAISRIMRLPLPYEERIAMVNEILESCPEAAEPENPPTGRTTS